MRQSMNLFDISAILITATALTSYINYKWLNLPSSIGLLILAILVGLIANFLNKIGIITYSVDQFLVNINFHEVVFHGLLSFLLFAGALQINIEDLRSLKLPIAITATISTLLSTLIIGSMFYYLGQSIGFKTISYSYAILFGAILSPTDPIAILSIIKKMSASKIIETTIIGESLFNDGVAIVLFISILEIITTKQTLHLTHVFYLILYQTGGGIVFGVLIGWLAYKMLLKINVYQVELLITLAVATGGYALGSQISISAPIAMVVAGVIIGNHGRRNAMSINSRKYIDIFWEIIDDILNAVLFLLIGLEMMTIHLNKQICLLALLSILIALIARFISLAIPLSLFRSLYKVQKGIINILTWGGLRGALSIAMVLSIKDPLMKEIFLPCIYFVVFFSVTVQGLTFNKVLKKYKLST
jgi:CPA1 family monovalent cation:H+ antiporter